ncbi:MAG: lactonase family protein [Dehalococcoidia bacterium]|nr:lactonase family protein [Dehalococcoidia bacterium]MSQ16839.1 lactonase family protein [Dehalococcoidia bacterium]
MPTFMYVSLQGDDRILIFAVNSRTGALTPKGEAKVAGGPAPIAINPARQNLYIGRRGTKQLSSFKINQRTGGLTETATVALDTDPCWLATDRKGRFVLASYYEGMGVSVHPIGSDGSVGAPPAEKRQTFRGAHSFQTDPTNKFAFVPHIAGRGPNLILQFKFDELTGRLTPNTPDRVTPPEQDGPRHFCFHPSLNILYFSNEQGCSVTGYHLDTSSGALRPFQTVSTLPVGFQGQNSCSKIQITPSGKFLYAANRGHDSIAGFRVDATSGRLSALDRTPSEKVPRAFSIDPEGKFLYSAGIESGRMTAFKIDQATGKLDPMDTYPLGQRPMWVLITRLGTG